MNVVESIAEPANRFLANLDRVMVGKRSVGELVLVALLSDGHVLLDDVPGVGKTTLAKTVAKSLGCAFKRIQFTPDLLPSDVVGLNYFNQRVQDFEFRPGPLFSQVILADEINRATPRTQSALLEAMEERQITIEGETRTLPRPFLVMATQNPIELEGTFPLPEAQLDRFMLRLKIGYPTEADESEIVLRFDKSNPLDDLEIVVQAEELERMRTMAGDVVVEDSVREYLIGIVRATREADGVRLGASPRGSLGLFRGVQALAAIRGRSYVIPDDVIELAVSLLSHRIVLDSQARLRGTSAEETIAAIVERAPIPR